MAVRNANIMAARGIYLKLVMQFVADPFQLLPMLYEQFVI